jgi:hypothetical protein
VILATPHKELLKQQKQILDAVSPAGVFFDLSGVIDRELFDSADVLYWSL